MRTIKFRGERTDGKGWVYGSLVTYKSFSLIYTHNGLLSDYEVDPKTVGQFTGKLDDKGREVYEGNVYFNEIEEDHGDIRLYYVCTWIKEWSRFVMLSIGEYTDYQDNGIRNIENENKGMQNTFGVEMKNYHLAGNIHDNKDLLEK